MLDVIIGNMVISNYEVMDLMKKSKVSHEYRIKILDRKTFLFKQNYDTILLSTIAECIL